MTTGTSNTRHHRGSVMVIVLWVAFGLVSLTLYFAQSMSMERRAGENRGAAIQAEQAILGAVRYATNLLATAATTDPGRLPDAWTYRAEAVPIDEATFWFVGRPTTEDSSAAQPVFGLVDEGSRLNLNLATADMLQWLPRMTPELAAAIVDWRDTDAEPGAGGAEDETYLRLTPSYPCKNGPFESVEELLLIHGMTTEILYGEDWNRNGVLDPNENDGNLSPPDDNQDGRLDPGLVEFLTVATRLPVASGDSSSLVDVGSTNAAALATLLNEQFGTDRANAVLRQLSNPPPEFSSILEFYARSGLSAEEFSRIETNLTVSAAATNAVVNVNTASETVLACIPGIGTDLASTLAARRQSNTPQQASLAWVTEVLDTEQLRLAGPHLTGQAYQVTIDVAAVGRFGRGYRRVAFTCDMSSGSPVLVSRHDLADRGWALGSEARRNLLDTRTR